MAVNEVKPDEVNGTSTQQSNVEMEVDQPEGSSDVLSNGNYSTRSKSKSGARKKATPNRRSPTANASKTAIKEETPSSADDCCPLPSGSVFKLGMEGGHKTYVNQYSCNPMALNKIQNNEDRDRKRFLSQKFSSIGSSEFKWLGSTFGNKEAVLETIRSTLVQLTSQLPTVFMHPNWKEDYPSWISSVNACVSHNDLGNVLSVLAASIRPAVFNSTWHESLGHVHLQRQTALERTERAQAEIKEKKEKELEEEMNRLYMVRFTKEPRHQVIVLPNTIKQVSKLTL